MKIIQDHPKYGIKLDFRTNEDQQYFNPWEQRDTVVKFAGLCAVCSRRVYNPIDKDGLPYDPDPRGIFGQEHAAHHLVASEFGMTGPDLTLCFECGNTKEQYDKALVLAYRQWKEAIAKAKGDYGNAGCDKCGTYDRMPGSKFCVECAKGD